jgi:N-acetylglucosaminyldiphosphoundecaprenol N-acetyl-beta-D-mannosaminyltransferase
MRDSLLQADMIPADGMPLVWIQRARGCSQAERIYAPDVMEALCPATIEHEITHYFWGGEPAVTEKLVSILSQRFPGLKIAGYYSPPFAPLETHPNQAVVARINDANPSIVWVCLGSGKQELWMSMYRPFLKAPLLLSVGAAFNFLSGTVPQAPKWMQRNGLEWLFRLLTEPRRLAKRYLIYNPVFIYLILWEQLTLRMRHTDTFLE